MTNKKPNFNGILQILFIQQAHFIINNHYVSYMTINIL